jgi:acetyl-CoA C-acetyltransferase
MPATKHAARLALEMAGIKPDDIDLAEVHDCFTNTELLNIEDIGFCKKGEAHKLLKEGYWNREDGHTPINASGGLKSHGHPIAATGIGQIAENFWQLRQQIEPVRQVKLKKGIALSHNVGGNGFGASSINIIGREP